MKPLWLLLLCVCAVGMLRAENRSVGADSCVIVSVKFPCAVNCAKTADKADRGCVVRVLRPQVHMAVCDKMFLSRIKFPEEQAEAGEPLHKTLFVLKTNLLCDALT